MSTQISTKTIVQDEGTTVLSNDVINFTGPGVTVSNVGGAAKVNITGSLISAITSSGNVDQTLTTTASVINFDTDDTAAYGFISRIGNTFIVSTGGAGLYTFALQPQLTNLSLVNTTTFWVLKNAAAVLNSGVKVSSTGNNDTGVSPLIDTLNLVSGDVISFSAITNVVNGSRLDFTAASAPVPAVPAVIVDIKGWNI